jgi:hypothetical protein
MFSDFRRMFKMPKKTVGKKGHGKRVKETLYTYYFYTFLYVVHIFCVERCDLIAI